MEKNNGHKILLLDFRREFIDIAKKKIKFPLSTIPDSDVYKIVAIDESGCFFDNKNINAKYVLCPHSTPCRGNIYCDNVISCGMSSKSTFGLSSTNIERSMFSVNRAIYLGNEIMLPFEEPFKPDENLTLYENIIIHGIETLSSL